MTAEALAHRLEGTRLRSHGQWSARCPAHDDRTASLEFADGKDGHTVVWCHAGCSFEDIVAALQLSQTDFFASHELTSPYVGAHSRDSERAAVRALLGDRMATFAARADAFLCTFPHLSPTQPRAQLLYLHIAHKLDGFPTSFNERHGGRPSYSMTRFAAATMLRCAESSVTRFVGELHRKGVVPLIHVIVGKPRQASSFSLIEDPFRYMETQQRQGAARRDTAERQRAAMRAAGFPAEDVDANPYIKKREKWMAADHRVALPRRLDDCDAHTVNRNDDLTRRDGATGVSPSRNDDLSYS